MVKGLTPYQILGKFTCQRKKQRYEVCWNEGSKMTGQQLYQKILVPGGFGISKGRKAVYFSLVSQPTNPNQKEITTCSRISQNIPNGEACKVTKTTRARSNNRHRDRAERIPPPTALGELTTHCGQHKMNLDDESRNDHQNVLRLCSTLASSTWAGSSSTTASSTLASPEKSAQKTKCQKQSFTIWCLGATLCLMCVLAGCAVL